MKTTMIKEKAKALGIKPGKKSGTDLIRTIQETEGNFPCFKTAAGFCDQNGCLWRGDCISSK